MGASGWCAEANDDTLLEGCRVKSWSDEGKEVAESLSLLSSLSASLTVMKGSDDKVALDRLAKP